MADKESLEEFLVRMHKEERDRKIAQKFKEQEESEAAVQWSTWNKYVT